MIPIIITAIVAGIGAGVSFFVGHHIGKKDEGEKKKADDKKKAKDK
jgi:Na+-driven multidrug efflux pump